MSASFSLSLSTPTHAFFVFFLLILFEYIKPKRCVYTDMSILLISLYLSASLFYILFILYCYIISFLYPSSLPFFVIFIFPCERKSYKEDLHCFISCSLFLLSFLCLSLFIFYMNPIENLCFSNPIEPKYFNLQTQDGSRPHYRHFSANDMMVKPPMYIQQESLDEKQR